MVSHWIKGYSLIRVKIHIKYSSMYSDTYFLLQCSTHTVRFHRALDIHVIPSGNAEKGMWAYDAFSLFSATYKLLK